MTVIGIPPRRTLLARLGALSGYRQVTASLLLLAITAFALSGIALLSGDSGWLAYSPAELGLSLAVLVPVSLGANALLALAFRVHAHHESALITALLLFLLLFPSSDPGALAGIALVAVLANATKYLLAIGRHHLLNPAAAGAALSALLAAGTGWGAQGEWLQPGLAAWWVGSTAQLPLVAATGLLLVWRLRAWAPALSYLGIGLAVAAASFAAGGLALVDALQTALLSTPVLFAAAFMITEPLTLPARRWQQAAVAAVAAAAGFAPWHLGAVYASPELGIVLGNLLAFALSPRRSLRLRLLEQQELTGRSRAFRFTPLPGLLGRPRFAGGSYLELELPHTGTDARGSRRAFSITSAQSDAELQIGVRLSERGSSFKRRLAELPPGSELRATWIGGDFTLPARGPVLLIAGGIGITPFIGQLAELAARGGDAGRVTLLYRASAAEGHAYADRLAASGATVLLSGAPAAEALPEGWRHLGPERLDAAALDAAVPDLAGRRALIAGPPGFIAAWRGLLRGRVRGRLRTDAFTGY